MNTRISKFSSFLLAGAIVFICISALSFKAMANVDSLKIQSSSKVVLKGSPLISINGKISDKSLVNLQQIKEISFLSPEAAQQKYGVEAPDGLMEITTKESNLKAAESNDKKQVQTYSKVFVISEDGISEKDLNDVLSSSIKEIKIISDDDDGESLFIDGNNSKVITIITHDADQTKVDQKVSQLKDWIKEKELDIDSEKVKKGMESIKVSVNEFLNSDSFKNLFEDMDVNLKEMNEKVSESLEKALNQLAEMFE